MTSAGMMLGSGSAAVSTVSGRTRVGVDGEDHGLDLDEAAILHAELSKIGCAAVHAVGANERLVGCGHSLQRQLHHDHCSVPLFRWSLCTTPVPAAGKKKDVGSHKPTWYCWDAPRLSLEWGTAHAGMRHVSH